MQLFASHERVFLRLIRCVSIISVMVPSKKLMSLRRNIAITLLHIDLYRAYIMNTKFSKYTALSANRGLLTYQYYCK